MQELIERIENASEPSRAMDALIEIEVRRWQAEASGLDEKHWATWHPVGNKGEVICGQGLTRYHPPTYTFSVDDAALLVPDNNAWTLGQNVHHLHWQASVNTLDGDGSPFSLGCSSATKTASLALCAAALRARLALRQGHRQTGE